MRVPTREYGRILYERGYRAKAVTVFRRGVDGRYFAPRTDARRILSERYGLGDGDILLYAGRISQEKNLDFLIDIYAALHRDRAGLRLLVVGSGPYLADMKERCRELDGVVFAGKLQGEDLVDVYAGSDLLVFPSTTDTYGMVVAEAQACGLPAVVSDKGGPQELVLDGESGFIIGTGSTEAWRQEIDRLLRLKAEKPARFKALREAARRAALERSDWNAILDELTGLSAPVPSIQQAAAVESGLFAVPAA
jgi:glycosyltransferase involved in cell wall biosynthesis